MSRRRKRLREWSDRIAADFVRHPVRQLIIWVAVAFAGLLVMGALLIPIEHAINQRSASVAARRLMEAHVDEIPGGVPSSAAITLLRVETWFYTYQTATVGEYRDPLTNRRVPTPIYVDRAATGANAYFDVGGREVIMRMDRYGTALSEDATPWTFSGFIDP